MTFYAAREYLPYAVTFNNNTGTSKDNAFKNLYVRAGKNEYVTLPKGSVSERAYVLAGRQRQNRQRLSTKKGQKVRITKKQNFMQCTGRQRSIRCLSV